MAAIDAKHQIPCPTSVPIATPVIWDDGQPIQCAIAPLPSPTPPAGPMASSHISASPPITAATALPVPSHQWSATSPVQPPTGRSQSRTGPPIPTLRAAPSAGMAARQDQEITDPSSSSAHRAGPVASVDCSAAKRPCSRCSREKLPRVTRAGIDKRRQLETNACSWFIPSSWADCTPTGRTAIQEPRALPQGTRTHSES